MSVRSHPINQAAAPKKLTRRPAYSKPQESQEKTAAEDDFDYVSVKPKNRFTIQVRYVLMGRGRPLPYDFQFDD